MTGDSENTTRIRSGLPRALEMPAAAIALLLVSPLLVVLWSAVRLTSSGPGFFHQVRVGRNGRLFTLFKLRTMRESAGGAEKSRIPGDHASRGLEPAVTASGDPRITPLGRLLRRAKLDELPQLWNVVRGDLSFVGPRPEVPRFVDLEDQRWQALLAVRPGLTDPTTIALRDEEALLARLAPHTEDRERVYREVLLPQKLDRSLAYLRQRSIARDLLVLLRTATAIVFRRRPPAS